MSRSARRTIDLEQSWDYIQKGIMKLKNNLEGLTEEKLSSEENMMLYTTIYDICTQKTALEPYYFRQFSDKFRESLEEYILSTVLPTLREKHEEFVFFEHYEEVMLRELVKRWANYNIMVKGLYRFFSYVDRPFPRLLLSLPPLKDVGLTCFRELVYKEINGKMRDAVISLIGQEREGKQIDRALLKNVVDIFVEIGNGKMGCYKNDFEAAMLEDTASYYSRKASKWILEHYSRLDYTLKVEKCLKMEKERAAHYLHSSSEPKLLERVRHELLSVHARC